MKTKKEVAAWSASSPFPSPSVPPPPKGRGHDSPFAQKEKEKFTKKRKTGCVLVQNVVSYKGVQK
ncbi:MAG: hypothetical protein UC771_07595 [Faecalibacterium sp.]|nr:hypothetical protein [Faecalibacterium sp.]